MPSPSAKQTLLCRHRPPAHSSRPQHHPAGSQVRSHALSPASLPPAGSSSLLAGMAACSMQPLLAGAGLDPFVSHFLPLLSLHDLGRLSSTYRRVRTVVDTAPDAVWKATARHSQPHPDHPVHRAASCPAYLRQQHAVHAAINSGHSAHRTFSSPGPGELAPDLATCALLNKANADAGYSLELRDLASQHLQASFSLPDLDYDRSSFSVTWDWTSGRCAVRWGRAWYRIQPGTQSTGGVCIVDTRTGSVAVIDLGPQPATPSCGGFAAGLLLLRHTVAATPVWTAFCAAGRARHRIDVPAHCLGLASPPAVAPTGMQAALILGWRDLAITLWQRSADRTLRVDLPADLGGLLYVVWSPCSSLLLCLTQTSAVMMSAEGSSLSVTSLSSCPSRAAWRGDLVVIVCLPDNIWAITGVQATQLCIYTVDGSHLVFKARLDISSIPGKCSFMYGPAISPDWQHIAVTAVQYTGNSKTAESLVVLRSDGTLCMASPLSNFSIPTELSWSPSGAAVASHRMRSYQFAVELVTCSG